MEESAAIAAEDPPALVNFAATRCRLDSAAYVATILDLAARGYLVLTEPEPTHLRCGQPAAPPPDSGLFPSERMVLRDVRSRLAVLDDAPFEALAEACSADVRGCWDPFEKAVRAEARARGLTRPRLSAGTRGVLQAAAVAVGVVGYLAVQAHSGGTWVALSTGFLAWILPASWIGAVGRWERLSTSGRDLARWAQARGDSLAVGVVGGVVPAPMLKHLAYAVAGGAPVPIAGLTGPAAGDWAGHAGSDPAGWTGPDLPGPAAAGPADWTGGDLAGPAAAVLADLASRPPLSAARLLTDTEVSEALGRPVRSIGLTTPVGGAVIYRGSGVTVSVTVAVGALRGLSSGPARRFGDPLPGIGDEAWLVNRNRTLVVRVGVLTAKITIGAQGLVDTYSVLAGLAPTLAARLAEYDS